MENGAIAIPGAAAGLLLGFWGLRILTSVFPADLLPRQAGIAINSTVLAFVLLLSVLATLLFGALPALHASRADVNDALKETVRSTGGHQTHWRRRALAVSEISIATTEQARASEELAKASEQMGAMTHEAAAPMREQAITSNQILESVSEIENRTAQVARASTEQQGSVEALASRIQRSSDLGNKNSEAIADMSASADEVHAQASSLGDLVGQFETGHAAVADSTRKMSLIHI